MLKVLIYFSDTAFHPEIVPYVEGVDLLYHEATFAERDLARAKETFHSTLDEAREVFPETILGNEGMVLSV